MKNVFIRPYIEGSGQMSVSMENDTKLFIQDAKLIRSAYEPSVLSGRNLSRFQ